MDDLISRWAAIDALTDTNLKRNADSVYDGDMNRARRAAQRVIAQLPTIDAIPVEWLNVMKRLAADYGDNECVNVIEYLFVRWQEEQEANDGQQ